MAGTLHSYASQGSVNEVRELISNGVDVNERNDVKQTALMLASASGYSALVRYLIEANANVCLVDKDGYSALFFATYCGTGHPEIVKLLIEAKADLNVKDNTSRTPLIYAADHGKIEIVKLLLDAGADANYKDKFNNTALLYAYNSKYKKHEIMSALMTRRDTSNDIDISEKIEKPKGLASFIQSLFGKKVDLNELLITALEDDNGAKRKDAATKLINEGPKTLKPFIQYLKKKGGKGTAHAMALEGKPEADAWKLVKQLLSMAEITKW